MGEKSRGLTQTKSVPFGLLRGRGRAAYEDWQSSPFKEEESKCPGEKGERNS